MVYHKIYSLISTTLSGKKVPSDATSMPQGEGETIYILHFEPEDPMKIQGGVSVALLSSFIFFGENVLQQHINIIIIVHYYHC